MRKLFGTAAAAVMLGLSVASFGQTSSREASASDATAVPEAGSDYHGGSTRSAASRRAERGWWIGLGLSAADVGEAALPWTTHPGLEDETRP
jgi:hypothetical protein